MVIIAGIHTGIGKTLCSAILCEAWGYDYWKPIQAGDLDNSDSIFIKNHVGNPLCHIHPEAYRFQTAASPHLKLLSTNFFTFSLFTTAILGIENNKGNSVYSKI